ncbi:NAD-binding protein [Kitasatospora cinereorecta]|uniref:NAD-binding protein n=1 Tax=Kitasatospora cinereorecta TaxID=285560 RepID=A0ABW0V916_9ACTN
MTDEGRGTPQTGTIRGHYIVCGGNAIAHRLIQELIEQYEVPVVALVPDLAREHGPRIEQLPGVSAVVESATITEDVLRTAGIGTALGIALVDATDQENIHAALTAQQCNAEVRIVLRIFNQRLGEHLERLLPNGIALSGSATAAPAFANGALGRPNSVQVGDRFLYVAHGEDIRDNQVCLVADRIDPNDLGAMRLLPDAGSRASAYIELAQRVGDEGPIELGRRQDPAPEERGQVAALQALTSEPPLPIPLWKRLRWWGQDALRYFTSARLRMVLTTALVAVLVGAAVLWQHSGSLGWTLYYTLLDVAGAAQPDMPGQELTGGAAGRAAQVLITFCGITFVPVATAIVVEALASGRRGIPRAPGARTRDHVVVVGLGNVGSRVAALVHGTGVPVVCIERDPQARGIEAVRALGLPVVIGDGPLAAQLVRARARHARAVVAVTSDDAANLEAALEARAVRPDIRIVVRLFDDNFAHLVYATLGNVASRSVSYLAAPAFAAALMGREVLGTLSVYRHVLLIAELAADEGSGLIGQDIGDIEGPGGVRVIAVRLARLPGEYLWNYADRARRLAAGDRVVVAATRAGLARLIQ